MLETGMYKDAEIISMFKNLDRGGRMAGAVFRHPGIGSYSLQKVFFQIAEEAQGETVYVPRIDQEVGYSVIKEASDNLDQGIRKSSRLLSFGPMVGLAGDFDFDILAVVAARPDMEKAFAEELGGRELNRGFSGDSAYNKAYMELAAMDLTIIILCQLGMVT